MNLNELKPCENCGGPIGPMFYKVEVSSHVVDYGAVNRFLGLQQYFQGNQELAWVFAPDREYAKEFSRYTKVLCQKCFMECLPVLLNSAAELPQDEDEKPVKPNNELRKRLGKKSMVACPRCGAQMVYRLNKEEQTVFLGCGRYPDCMATQEIPEALRLEILGYWKLDGF